MALLWGANGVASVQAVADVLTIALALPLIRRVKVSVRQAAREEAAKKTIPNGPEGVIS